MIPPGGVEDSFSPFSPSPACGGSTTSSMGDPSTTTSRPVAPHLDASFAAGPAVLDLKDYRLFQAANLDAMRHLLASIQQTMQTYHQLLEHLTTSHTSDLNSNYERGPLKDVPSAMSFSRTSDDIDRVDWDLHLSALILHANCQLECHFHAFWSELFLQALPASLQHYCDYGVIAVDMQALLAHLLTANGAAIGHSQNSSPPGFAARRVTAPLSPSPQWEVLAREDIDKLSFEDFLSFYNEHTGQAGRSLHHALYADLLTGVSPAFVELIQRHGDWLENWQF